MILFFALYLLSTISLYSMDDFNTYKDHTTIKNNNGVASIAFDSSGEYLFVGSGKGMIHIYSVSDFKEKKNFSIGSGYVRRIACDAIGKYCAIGLEEINESLSRYVNPVGSKVCLYDVSNLLHEPDAAPIKVLDGHRDERGNVAIDPAGETLAIWDAYLPCTHFYKIADLLEHKGERDYSSGMNAAYSSSGTMCALSIPTKGGKFKILHIDQEGYKESIEVGRDEGIKYLTPCAFDAREHYLITSSCLSRTQKTKPQINIYEVNNLASGAKKTINFGNRHDIIHAVSTDTEGKYFAIGFVGVKTKFFLDHYSKLYLFRCEDIEKEDDLEPIDLTHTYLYDSIYSIVFNSVRKKIALLIKGKKVHVYDFKDLMYSEEL